MKKSTVKSIVKAPAKRAQPEAKSVLPMLLKSLTELYPRDLTMPGVVLAYLPAEKCFYGSVVRYEKDMAQGKVVLFSTKKPTSEEVVIELGSLLFRDQFANANALRRLVSKAMPVLRVYDFDHDFSEWNETVDR